MGGGTREVTQNSQPTTPVLRPKKETDRTESWIQSLEKKAIFTFVRKSVCWMEGRENRFTRGRPPYTLLEGTPYLSEWGVKVSGKRWMPPSCQKNKILELEGKRGTGGQPKSKRDLTQREGLQK